MRITIDTETKQLIHETDEQSVCLDLYSDAAFALIAEQWLKVGWN